VDGVGGDGDDTMFGSSSVGGKVDMTKFKISEDTTAKVTFNYEEAGYQNALGVYKIGPDGTISGVQILFANASLQGSGGDLIAGVSSVDLAVKSGEKLGFFVVPDGFNQRGMAELLSDATATFKFVDANGKAGNVNAGGELKLVQTNKSGVDIVIKSAYGTTVFHSVDSGSSGLDGDGFKHVAGTVNNIDGTVKIGFEDLRRWRPRLRRCRLHGLAWHDQHGASCKRSDEGNARHGQRRDDRRFRQRQDVWHGR